MKWDQVPNGVSVSMSRDTAMKMRGGGPQTFLKGMLCGAVLVFALQSCSSDETPAEDKPSPKTSPSSVSINNKH